MCLHRYALTLGGLLEHQFLFSHLLLNLLTLSPATHQNYPVKFTNVLHTAQHNGPFSALSFGLTEYSARLITPSEDHSLREPLTCRKFMLDSLDFREIIWGVERRHIATELWKVGRSDCRLRDQL